MAKTYEDGLKDAWEVVRRLEYELTHNERVELFGYYSPYDIIDTLTPQEVIGKLEKHDRIEIGDEVIDSNSISEKKSVVVRVDGTVITIMEDDGTAIRTGIEGFKKTGRHFPQIAKVLKQMKEGEGR